MELENIDALNYCEYDWFDFWIFGDDFSRDGQRKVEKVGWD